MNAVKDSSDTVSASIKKALQENKAAILEQIAQLDKRLEAANAMLEEQKMKAAETHAAIEAIQADVKMLLTQVEANQKAINEVKMILENAKGVHEEPSTTKRTLVFLTTVAAGIGWFAMNAIGGRSGE